MNPAWYVYELDGGDILMTIEEFSTRATLLAEHGRCSVLVHRERPTMRYAAAEGPVSLEQATPESTRRMVSRYLPASAVAAYVSGSAVETFVQVQLRPQRWLGADLGDLAALELASE